MSILYEKIEQKYKNPSQLKFVEYGCGSGAIGLSLHRKYTMSGIMIDINEKCTNLTKKNANINKCNLQSVEIIQSPME